MLERPGTPLGEEKTVPEFAVRIEQPDPETVVIALLGEVDLSNAPAFEEALLSQVGFGVSRVVIDLQQTTFFDSTALRVLLIGHRKLDERGGSMCVVCGEPQILKIFSITGVDEIIAFHPTLAQALASPDETFETFDAVA
jgi:anti-anti-sigma factor